MNFHSFCWAFVLLSKITWVVHPPNLYTERHCAFQVNSSRRPLGQPTRLEMHRIYCQYCVNPCVGYEQNRLLDIDIAPLTYQLHYWRVRMYLCAETLIDHGYSARTMGHSKYCHVPHVVYSRSDRYGIHRPSQANIRWCWLWHHQQSNHCSASTPATGTYTGIYTGDYTCPTHALRSSNSNTEQTSFRSHFGGVM